MCVCTFARVCLVCVHECACVQACLHECAWCVGMCACVYMYTSVCMHVARVRLACVHVCACVRACCMSVPGVCTRVFLCVGMLARVCMVCWHVCMCAHVQKCVHACHECAWCVCTCVLVCVHGLACAHICVCACAHMCVFLLLFSGCSTFETSSLNVSCRVHLCTQFLRGQVLSLELVHSCGERGFLPPTQATQSRLSVSTAWDSLCPQSPPIPLLLKARCIW